ncbi:MAG: hypothetical protein PUD20_04460 [bacterium]|nr:hypothetical protein [bacterium]
MNRRKTAPLTGNSESEEKRILREAIEKERKLLNEQLSAGRSPLECMEQSRKVDQLLEQYIDMK